MDCGGLGHGEGESRPRFSLTEQTTIEQTDAEASSSGWRRRVGRHRSSRRARREPEVEHHRCWSCDMRCCDACHTQCCVMDFSQRDLTTQSDREALVQSLARVWKCATARQRRCLLLFLFRRICSRPECRNIEDSISVSVWIEQNDPRLDRHRRSS